MTGRPERLPLLVLCGPTASGKTGLAVELAQHVPIEVISADSRQVYRWMNIGTAKASPEEQRAVAHHLLDVVDPDEAFSAADFARLAHAAIQRIHRRGRLPVLVGGTGFYLTAITRGLVDAPSADPHLREQLLQEEAREGEGTLHHKLSQIDPQLAGRLSPRDLVRIVRALEVHAMTGQRFSELQARHAFQEDPYRTVTIGVAVERETLYARIDQRTQRMFADGLMTEAAALLARGFSPGTGALRTIGYREAIRSLAGEISLAEATALAAQETRRYAKRQMTWFRKNNAIIWLDSSREFDKMLKLAKRLHME